MLSFKPSTLPMKLCTADGHDGCAAEWRPTVVEREVVARRMAPLFVKVDHRLVHSHEIAAFMNTLCLYLTEPSRLSTANFHRLKLDRRNAQELLRQY